MQNLVIVVYERINHFGDTAPAAFPPVRCRGDSAMYPERGRGLRVHGHRYEALSRCLDEITRMCIKFRSFDILTIFILSGIFETA